MSTNLGDRLATQAAAEEQGITAKRDASADLDVLNWINAASTRAEIAKALPRGLDEARFMRMVQTEVRKNPALLESEPRSFILGVLTVAQLGLELGPLGQAYLTGPFEVTRGDRKIKETVLIIGYKGLCELAYRSETIDLVDAVTVHEGEPFKVTAGTDPHIDHQILLDKREGPAIAYYAIAVPKGGRVVFDVMTPAEIERIKKRSKAAASKFSPWTTDYEAMAQKTVIRRLLNRGRVRLSPQIQEAIAEDETRELGADKAILLDPALMPIPAPPAEPEQPAETAAATEPAAEQAQTSTETATPAKPEPPKPAQPAAKPANTTDPGAAFR